MTVSVTPLMDRGKTYLGSDQSRTLDATTAAQLEGTRAEFSDADPTVVNGPQTLRSNKTNVCMLVRNELATGLAVEAKRVVKWKSGFRDRQIDGYCCITDEACAGVVDEFLGSAGAPLHDLFWLCVKGRTLVKTSLAANAENVIAMDDRLGALTAVTSGATTAGRVIASVFTGATLPLVNAIQNGFARALSAKTTANTNVDVLIDCYFLKS